MPASHHSSRTTQRPTAKRSRHKYNERDCRSQVGNEFPRVSTLLTSQVDASRKQWPSLAKILRLVKAPPASITHTSLHFHRPSCEESPLDTHNACLITLPGVFRQDSAVPSDSCTSTFRNYLISELVAGVRTQMGSLDPIDQDALLLIAALPNNFDSSASPHCESVPVPTKRSRRRSIQPWRVGGFCVAVAITAAYRAHLTSSPDSSDQTNNSQVHHIGDVWCTGTTFCGIQSIWVHQQHRHKHLATALTNEARHRICFGCVIPAEHVAFSEPTAEGSQFALHYSGRSDFLVY